MSICNSFLKPKDELLVQNSSTYPEELVVDKLVNSSCVLRMNSIALKHFKFPNYLIF